MLAGIALAAGGPQVVGPQIVGIASAVVNDVRLKPAQLAQLHRAALRERVALADSVLTGQRSQLQMLLLDKSVFTVGANARLTIDRFVYDPAGNHAFGATVAKGAFRFMSGRPDRGNDSAINTPVATIGIRGTLIDGVVGSDAVAIARHETAIDPGIRSDPETASLIVLRGPGPQAQAMTPVGIITVTAAGKTVLLDRPMLAAYVPAPGMAPIGPFSLSWEGLGRINALLFPAIAARLAQPKKSGFQLHIGLPLPFFGGGGDEPAQPGRQGKP
jgi:hypothetical protein